MPPARGGTGRPRNPKATAAARVEARAKTAALHEQLIEHIRALRTDDDWQRWLRVASRLGRQYSFRNTLLIAAARPDATAVAGYGAWQELGRQVRKGEKGIPILAPLVRRNRDEPTAGAKPADSPSISTEGTDDVVADGGRALAGFRVVHVFDISQTDGEPLAVQPGGPGFVSGQAPEGLWDALAGLIVADSFTIERGDCGGSEGRTDFRTHTVRVAENFSAAHADSVLLHEYGHIELHNPHDFANLITANCRGVEEVEAESAAYLVAAHAGLDTSETTFPYVTGWAASVEGQAPEDVIAATGRRVIQAATTIIDRLDAIWPTPQQADPRQAVLVERVQAGVERTSALAGGSAATAAAMAGARRPSGAAVAAQAYPDGTASAVVPRRGPAGHESPAASATQPRAHR